MRRILPPRRATPSATMAAEPMRAASLSARAAGAAGAAGAALALVAALGCTSVDAVIESAGDDAVLVEADLDPAELAARIDEIDALWREPRSVERVTASLDLAVRSVSSRNHHAAAWRAVRACAWLGRHHDEREARLEASARGIALGKAAVELSRAKRVRPHAARDAEPNYFLALAMGAYCEEKGTCDTSFVRAMHDRASAARMAEPGLDHCGPARFLGKLIVETADYPGYALGDLEDGVALLREALAACPDFPENALFLAEALIELGDDDEARALIERVLASRAPSDHSAEHGEWIARARELAGER